MLYSPSPPPLHFTSRGVSEQLCVCVSVGRSRRRPHSLSLPPLIRPMAPYPPRKHARGVCTKWRGGEEGGEIISSFARGAKAIFLAAMPSPSMSRVGPSPFSQACHPSYTPQERRGEKEKDCCTFLDMHA